MELQVGPLSRIGVTREEKFEVGLLRSVEHARRSGRGDAGEDGGREEERVGDACEDRGREDRGREEDAGENAEQLHMVTTTFRK